MVGDNGKVLTCAAVPGARRSVPFQSFGGDDVVDSKHFIFLALGFAFVLTSLHSAKKRRIVPTLIFGVLAWAAYVVPKWLIWPVADARDNRLMLLVGALILIGGPCVVLMLTWRKKSP